MSAPIIKFKTGGWGKSPIEAVECVRETAQSVWIAGTHGGGESRQAKVSGYICFHDTWELAHAYLLEKAERAVRHARENLEVANGKLGNIKGIKPPKEPA
jgi:hypothetical protein